MTNDTQDQVVGWTALEDRLLIARHRSGHENKTAFARSIGIGDDAVRSYERGDTIPRDPVLQAWARVTGYRHEWLLTGHGPSKDDDPGPGTVVPLHSKTGSQQEVDASRCTREPLRLVA